MKKKPLKSVRFSDHDTLNVGDEVFLGDLEQTDFFKDKCSTCYVELHGNESVEGKLIMEDSPCWGHETYDLIHEIGAKKVLRMEQWRPEFTHDGRPGAWRAGIEWFGENDFEFICEYPTLLECLRHIRKYMDKENKKIMPLIFLDIDGVLNNEMFGEIDSTKATIFREIVNKTSANVVLSSSWRFWDDKIKEIKDAGIDISSTTDLDKENQKPRGIAIKEWLDKYPEQGEKYAILDDDLNILKEQLPNFFHVPTDIGLTQEVASKVISHLL